MQPITPTAPSHPHPLQSFAISRPQRVRGSRPRSTGGQEPRPRRSRGRSTWVHSAKIRIAITCLCAAYVAAGGTCLTTAAGQSSSTNRATRVSLADSEASIPRRNDNYSLDESTCHQPPAPSAAPTAAQDFSSSTGLPVLRQVQASCQLPRQVYTQPCVTSASQ
jgi:hypothetical protein